MKRELVEVVSRVPAALLSTTWVLILATTLAGVAVGPGWGLVVFLLWVAAGLVLLTRSGQRQVTVRVLKQPGRVGGWFGPQLAVLWWALPWLAGKAAFKAVVGRVFGRGMVPVARTLAIGFISYATVQLLQAGQVATAVLGVVLLLDLLFSLAARRWNRRTATVPLTEGALTRGPAPGT